MCRQMAIWSTKYPKRNGSIYKMKNSYIYIYATTLVLIIRELTEPRKQRRKSYRELRVEKAGATHLHTIGNYM